MTTLLLACVVSLTGALPSANASAGDIIVAMIKDRARTWMQLVATGRVDSCNLASLPGVFSDVNYEANSIAASVADRAREVANKTHVRFHIHVPVKSAVDVERVMNRYGMEREDVEALNPGVDLERIAPGSRILIYRFDPTNPGTSIGRANRGTLTGGMPMVEGRYWTVRFPNESWGTPETISHLVRGLTWVGEQRRDASASLIGDISYKNGGRMPPHRSHRSGRDVDATYYSYSPISGVQFWDARYSNDFDVAAQWELFRYWIKQDVVSYLFVDRAIQRVMYEHAIAVERDRAFVERVFEYPEQRAGSVIRHVPGHDDHYHARFRCAERDRSCHDF